MHVQLTAIIILLILSGIFSATETAFTSLSFVQLKILENRKKRAAKLVYTLSMKPEELITTVLVGNNVVNITVSSLVTTFSIEFFSSQPVGYATGLLTLVILIFGEITPKQLALTHNMKIAVFMAYPFMLLTISVIAVLGNSIFNLILVLGLSDWVTYARTIRGSVLSIKGKEFVMAARSVGTAHRVILLRHVFPNVLSPILVLSTVRVANIIIWESGLSFLGMGVPPPMPTWGRMLAEGRVYIADAWWLVTLPGLAIMLTILSINLLGDGLRDALDPRLRNIPT